MFVGFKGGLYSRGGTRYVGRSKQTAQTGAAAPRLIPFSFRQDQQYVLEFGDAYFRIISNGGYVIETDFAITGATKANPCQITAPGHNFADGDWVAISEVLGMIQLNGNTYIVANSNTGSGTFTLEDLDGFTLNSTAYPAYVSGGIVARIYTVASPYSAVNMPLVKYTQSADTMSLTHPSYPPQELVRNGPTDWSIAPAAFSSSILPPSTCSATATTQPDSGSSPPTLPCAYAYVVTAVDQNTGAESIPSPIANVTDSVDMSVTAGSVIVAWSPVVGNVYYNVYRAPPSYNTDPGNTTDALPVPIGAPFGFVGQAFGTQFVDSNTIADTTQSPPQHKDPFAPGQILFIDMTSSSSDWTTAAATISTSTGNGFEGACVISGSEVVAVVVLDNGHDYAPGDSLVITGDGTSATGTLDIGPASGTYPGVVTYFQQRRVYASTTNNPDTYWMSQPGAFLNFDSSVPVNNNDAITGTPWAEQVDGINWMVQMPLGLVTFTGSAVWQVGAPGSFASNPAAISPSNQLAAPQSSIGASPMVSPIRVNWDIVYLQSNGATVRDLTYQLVFNIYTGADISWPSSHLLAGHQLVDWAWCQEPYRVIWSVRDDGVMLSLTYVKEQEIYGWARHTTQGQVRSLCTVAELPVDALYMVVQRPVAGDGSTRYLIERMDNRTWNSVEDAWAVDAGVATVLPNPAADIGASTGVGNAVFTTTADVFAAGDVGKTLRMGGGIATVTQFVSISSVNGTWIYPCQDIIPDDPNSVPFSQRQGTWSLAPNVTEVGGLMHLAGKQVVGLADGVPVGPLVPDFTGFVTLPFPASLIILGLGFTAQMQSVYLDTGNPTIQGTRKVIPAATVRSEASSPMQAGSNQVDASTLSPAPLFVNWPGLATAKPQGAALPATYTSPGGRAVQPLFTGDTRIPIQSGWKKPGQVAVQQTLPLPLSVLALIPEIQPGDTPEVQLPPRQQRQAA
jgi:hypothetical protein